MSEAEGIDRRGRPPIGKSVPVSFRVRVRVVRASGRGGAVWACERECLTLGLRAVRSPPPGRGLRVFIFAAMFIFCGCLCKSLLLACAYLCCFFMLRAYVFDGFHREATIIYYLCDFSLFLVGPNKWK